MREIVTLQKDGGRPCGLITGDHQAYGASTGCTLYDIVMSKDHLIISVMVTLSFFNPLYIIHMQIYGDFRRIFHSNHYILYVHSGLRNKQSRIL